MIRRLRDARLRVRREDDGIAMVSVIAMGALLAILVVSATAFALGTQRTARSAQDWNGAMAAAYAGIEEYQSRLANDPGYFIFGNPASTFSSTSGSTVTLPEVSGGPAAANPAFGVGAGGGWAEVAGSDGTAAFRYEVDNSEYYESGTLRIRATGLAGGETRSLVADLRQTGFIEFLYFTDYEIQDPEISGADPGAACEVYRYQGRNSAALNDGGCGTITFFSGDTINGPLHTNDAFQISGSPSFNGWTTSSYNPASGNRYFGTGSPNFPVMPGNQPAYGPILGMPETNSELKKETRPDIPDLVPRPGCLYTGPTKIVFAADGTMRVHSPWTRYTSPVAGTNNAGCGTPGTTGLGQAGGQVINAPDNNVIYVQNVPTNAADANYWVPTDSGRPTCLAEDHSSASGRNAAGNPVGYPLAGEYVANASVYGCENGDVFVEGTVNAKVTIAAENYIYVTDDLVYADENDDVLGLVGQNAVYIHNPRAQSSPSPTTVNTVVETRTNRTLTQARSLTGYTGWSTSSFSGNGWSCNRTSGWSTSSYRYTCNLFAVTTTYSFSGRNEILNNADYVNRTVEAAILSVAHTFGVQNFRYGGNRGTLTVTGAIAQKFRGPVGMFYTTGSVASGYAKEYSYDERFRYSAPPKFLSPVTTVYGVTVWVEISPVFDPDGSYR